MKLQMASRLAIYAVLELAADPAAQLSAAEIGRAYGISTHHLSKVLHVLGRAGLVKSVRGAGGGYQISGNIRRTTLMDVVSLFESVGGGGDDPPPSGAETPAGGALTQVLGEIDAIAEATLRSITIATMLKLVRQQASAD